jgi:hypothetical protein
MLKVLLRELGFKWNGVACNLTQFFMALRNFLHGANGVDSRSTGNLSEFDEMPEMAAISPKKGRSSNSSAGKVIGMLQDVFYATKRNLYELFRVGTQGKTLDFDGFKSIIADCSRCYLSDSDVELTYKHVCGSLTNSMTFE